MIDALAEIGYEGNFTYEADYFFQRRPPEIAPAEARLMASIGRTLIKRFEERTAKKNAKERSKERRFLTTRVRYGILV